MNNKTTINQFLDNMKQSKRVKIGIAVIFYILAFTVTIIASLPQRYELNAGDIATENIVAPRKIVDATLTKKLKEQSASQTPNVYDYIPSSKKNAVNNINKVFLKVNKLKKNYEQRDIEIINSQTGINLKKATYDTLVGMSKNERNDMRKEIISFMKTMYQKEIKSDKMKVYYNNITEHYRYSSHSSEKSDAMIDITKNGIKANMILNEDATKQAKENVMNSVEEITYEPGEIIIKKGDTITPAQIDILKQGGMIRDSFFDDANNMAGTAIMLLFLLFVYSQYLKIFHSYVFYDNKLLALIASQILLMIVLAHVANMFNVYLIPISIMSMTLCTVISPRIAINTNVFMTLFLGVSMDMNIQGLVFIILSGFVGILFMQRVSTRGNIYKASASVSATNMIIVFIYALFSNCFEVNTLHNIAYAGINGILSGMIALAMMLFWEYVFGLLTPFKLLELTSPSNELIRKMISNAPGTYQHSLLVGNLAQEACNDIGADGLLARVGAYYHDIGKTEKPLFFSENQSGNNPHDHLDPNVSVRIIKNHVNDGIYLAEKNNLPDEIQEFIQTHHGNSLIKFFYYKEKKKGIEPDKKIYSYGGPTPSTVETTVVMLADSVEAAVRSMDTDDVTKIEMMIDKIIKTKIADKQLINSPLKMRDIETVKKSFLKVLTGVYHERVQYPGQNDEGDNNHE